MTQEQPFWAAARLTLALTQREIDQRYRGTFGGLGWYVFNNLAMLAIYTVVFGLVFKVRWPDAGNSPTDFALRLFVGLIVFNVVLEVVSRAPSLIVANPNYVKKVVFPLSALPVVTMGAALFNAFVAYLVLVGAMLAAGHWPTIHTLFAPLVIIALLPGLLGVAWALSALGVYVRDVGQIVPLITTGLLFMSPVFFPQNLLPEWVRPIVAANPLSAPINAARALALDGQIPDLWPLAAQFGIGLFVAVLGYLWFRASRPGFADVL